MSKKSIFMMVLLSLYIILIAASMFKPQSLAKENVNEPELVINENEEIDNIFSSKYIDDIGLRSAMKQGLGQDLDQTFYDEKHDIKVTFKSVMTDDMETKLLLTYQSKTTNLENYYIDLFEGESSINLIVEDEQKVSLDYVGWGSRSTVF